MASFDIPLFGCGLVMPGAFDVDDQHWPRRLEAVGLNAQGHFLQRRDREEHEKSVLWIRSDVCEYGRHQEILPASKHGPGALVHHKLRTM
jgi:hypothetical protein